MAFYADRLHLTPAYDLANLVVHAMHAGDVERTIIGGQCVYDASCGGSAFDGCPVAATAKDELVAAAHRLGLRPILSERPEPFR